MDLSEAMQRWEALGHSYVSWDTTEAYWILFLKHREVVGHVKTVAGSMSWSWPDELVGKQATAQDFELALKGE
jgi:hypothetical protein